MIEESAALGIAQYYLLETTEYLEGLVTDSAFDHPSSRSTEDDRSQYYRPKIPPTWIFRFYLSPPDDEFQSQGGWPPPQINICVDAETGQVWQHYPRNGGIQRPRSKK